VVQVAQWAIFALSIAAFWLAANLAASEATLAQMTGAFLLVGGILVTLSAIPSLRGAVDSLSTDAVTRAPFWMLLAAVSCAQLLSGTGTRWRRAFLLVVVVATVVRTFAVGRRSASGWVGVGVALATVGWLRFPRLRWPAALAVVGTTLAGILFPTVYEFAGGEADWLRTGGSRLALIGRVLEVTWRNPVMGLGPAAYRVYASVEPLRYRQTVWRHPMVSSHNNYVDLYAQGGLVGLALFGWGFIEIVHTGLRLQRRALSPFARSYVIGALAASAGALALMVLADWILPFVYNIGFDGFQASVLVWAFLGGLVALERWYPPGEPAGRGQPVATRHGSSAT
jgi:O-antigen ligase